MKYRRLTDDATALLDEFARVHRLSSWTVIQILNHANDIAQTHGNDLVEASYIQDVIAKAASKKRKPRRPVEAVADPAQEAFL